MTKRDPQAQIDELRFQNQVLGGVVAILGLGVLALAALVTIHP